LGNCRPACATRRCGTCPGLLLLLVGVAICLLLIRTHWRRAPCTIAVVLSRGGIVSVTLITLVTIPGVALITCCGALLRRAVLLAISGLAVAILLTITRLRVATILLAVPSARVTILLAIALLSIAVSTRLSIVLEELAETTSLTGIHPIVILAEGRAADA